MKQNKVNSEEHRDRREFRSIAWKDGQNCRSYKETYEIAFSLGKTSLSRLGGTSKNIFYQLSLRISTHSEHPGRPDEVECIKQNQPTRKKQE
jgi:hypothetical protein